MNTADLLGARLLLVTGKGGTGKSTLSAAIGLLAAERGRRVCVVEVDSFRPAMTDLLGVAPGYEPTPVDHGLWVCNVTWDEALEEWLERTVPAQRIVKLVLGNRIVRVFLDATPGAHDTVLLSRVVSLAEQFDLVVVDMPASGHAISLLRVPHLALRMMRVGPIHDRSVEVLATFRRPDTAVVLCCLPAPMVVNETIELRALLALEVPELTAPLVVLNEASRPTLSPEEGVLIDRLGAACAGDPAAAELVLAGRWERDLERSTADALARLAELRGTTVLQLPRLGGLGGFERGADRVVRQVAAALAREEVAHHGDDKEPT